MLAAVGEDYAAKGRLAVPQSEPFFSQQAFAYSGKVVRVPTKRFAGLCVHI